MIIKDNSQVDLFAEHILQNTPGLVPIDVRDYNNIKNSSRILNAVCIKLPINILNDFNTFIGAINTFNNNKANRLLLQICTVGNNIVEHGITMDEMAEILRGIVEHFGDIDIVWGLSSRDDPERCGYDINVIVGYDLPTV